LKNKQTVPVTAEPAQTPISKEEKPKEKPKSIFKRQANPNFFKQDTSQVIDQSEEIQIAEPVQKPKLDPKPKLTQDPKPKPDLSSVKSSPKPQSFVKKEEINLEDDYEQDPPEPPKFSDEKEFKDEIKAQSDYDSNVAFKKKYMPKLQPIPEN